MKFYIQPDSENQLTVRYRDGEDDWPVAIIVAPRPLRSMMARYLVRGANALLAIRELTEAIERARNE